MEINVDAHKLKNTLLMIIDAKKELLKADDFFGINDTFNAKRCIKCALNFIQEIEVNLFGLNGLDHENIKVVNEELEA